MTDFAPKTMAETLETMAEMDEHAASMLLPTLAELLARETPDDTDQFAAAQDEIMDVFMRITGLRSNAQGIRMILKLGEDE